MKTFPETLTLPPRTIIRMDGAGELLPECRMWGQAGFLVHGQSVEKAGLLKPILDRTPADMRLARWCHPGGEPTLDQLETLLAAARGHRAEWIAGVGGGSVLDLAKACAGLLNAPLSVRAYHDGAPLPPSHVPFAAVPTTAGTGSEATPVCVLTNAETGVKKSFRHPSLMAQLVILDAKLLRSCPPATLASSGMDALTQAIESYVSKGASEFSDTLSIQALSLIARSLETVFHSPSDERAQDLLTGSYLAGIALSHARLGLIHGLAHPLGARYHAPHGLVCAICLPHVIEFNREAMGQKYQTISATLGNDLLAESRRLLKTLKIESPFAGRPMQDVSGIVQETLASGSTAANPRAVTAGDVETILADLFRPS